MYTTTQERTYEYCTEKTRERHQLVENVQIIAATKICIRIYKKKKESNMI